MSVERTELPLRFSPPHWLVAVELGILVVPGLIFLALGAIVLFGHDQHRVGAFSVLALFGIGAISTSVVALSARVEVTSNVLCYRNIRRAKTIPLCEVEAVARQESKSGRVLKITTKSEAVLLGYLSFSASQLSNIEEAIRRSLAECSGETGVA
jgi:hypothetical protein